MFFRYNKTGIFWTLLILLLCLLPGKDMPDLSFWQLLTFDKVAHVFVFAVLVFVLATGFIKQYRFRNLRYNAVKSAFIFSILYGGATEILQGILTPDRHPEILDFAANAFGCGVGVATFFLIYGKNYSIYR